MNDSPQINDLPDIDSLWNYERPAETERAFRELLEKAAKSDEEYRAELLTQIARCQGLQGNFAEAHCTLDQVQEILTPGMPTVTARYLLERGRVFNSAGEAEKTGSLFRKAWDTAKEYGPDHLAVDAAHMIGIVEKGESSLAWNEKALSLARSSTDPRAEKWIGSLFNNIGWTRHEMGEYEKALELFQGALEFRKSQGNDSEIRIARWCVARCLRSLGRINEAPNIQRELEQDETSDGYVYEEIGECLLQMNKPVDAEPYFRKAYLLLSGDSWLQKNEKKRLNRLAELDNVNACDSGQDDD